MHRLAISAIAFFFALGVSACTLLVGIPGPPSEENPCGNGTVETDHDEQCDGTNLNGQSCNSLGYSAGQLSCDANCHLDVSGCTLVFQQVSIHDTHACAIQTNGILNCWGNNEHGQLGLGDTGNRLTPEMVGTGWLDVSTGSNHTCAIKDDHSLWCWGSNEYGQLGTSDTNDQNLPVQVGSGTDWQTVSTGDFHTCAINATGLWCWGNNEYGQLGINNQDNQSSPAKVITDIGNWESVSAGGNHTCAILNNNEERSLWCWGSNQYGQCGQPDTSSNILLPLLALPDAQSVSAGGNHTCAIRSDQTLWCWGRNEYGQLGIENTQDQTAPTRVGGSIPPSFSFVSAGGSHTCATMPNYQLFCWGDNTSGKLGIGTSKNTPHISPEQLDGNSWTSVSAGRASTCAIQANNSLYCWGSNEYGQLGLWDTENRNEPTLVHP